MFNYFLASPHNTNQNTIADLKSSEKGVSTIEYVILISLCSLICITAIAEVGIAARRKFYLVSEELRPQMDTSGLTEEGEG